LQINPLPSAVAELCSSPLQQQQNASSSPFLCREPHVPVELAGGMQGGFVVTISFVGITTEVVEKRPDTKKGKQRE